LGYDTTNGKVIYGGTNALTFTNPLQFDSGVRAATRTNLGATSVGNTVFTASNEATAATAIGLGTTNSPTFSNLTLNGTLGVSNAATFATNVSIAGSLSVGSLATTTPSTLALDATQTAAATNGVLTLPSNANVLRLTNANTISSVTNGVLGAFYYLVNQATNAVTISNVGGITIDGAQNLTLSPNESATLVATGPTNVSVAARGDLTDVALGGTANTAPSQTASSGSSLMTRDLVDTAQLRTFNKYATYEVFNFTTNMLTAIGGSASPNNYTGTSGALPSWAYATAAVDGTTNNQALYNANGALSKGDRTFKNWSKRNVFALRIQDMVLGGGTMRIYYGPVASTWAGGSLAVKGLGFELVGNSLSATVHNGTTNTTSSAVTTTNYQAYNVLMESDGAGGVRWWVNGVEQTALTGGPTGMSGQDSYGIVTEVINTTPTSDTVMFIESLQLIGEL
jgi:hypothetical protein